MRRFGGWLRANADVFLALVIAVSFGLLGVLDVLGPDDDQIVNAAILLTLALLAATLLRDRRAVGRALIDMSSVRLVSGPDVGQAHAEARRSTDRWIFKGGTGTYLRAVTLRGCVEIARQEARPLRMQLEIIDPTDEALCEEYARFRSSLTPGPDRTGERWTRERVRKESYATVLAACWYRQRFTFLSIEVGLYKVMSTFRWDLSSSCVIMTQEDPSGPTMIFEKDRPYYRAYSRELVASFKQARQVHVDRSDGQQLDDEPSIEETRRLFTLLGLDFPSSFTDRDVTEVIRKALQAKNPYW
ncbi:MAG: hypothetical protein ACRDRH_09915 [Pseudonocardia sp.]